MWGDGSVVRALQLGAGALPALAQLEVSEKEEFGDAGCDAVAGGVQGLGGAMPALQELLLAQCGQLSSGGRRALRLPPETDLGDWDHAHCSG